MTDLGSLVGILIYAVALAVLGSALLRQRKRNRTAESRLGQAEARLHAVFDTVVDGIITIDAKGIVKSFNPAAERIFGWLAAEVVGRNISMLMPEPDRGAHDGYLADYARTGQRRIIGIGREVTALRKDGTPFPLELAISELRMGEERLFTGIVRDISERKRIEHLKNEFVATVSHELRTPLTSIRGSLGLVAGGAAGELPDKARGLVDIAYKNSERLVLLVNDILDIEKIESGRMDLRLRPLDLIQLVEQAIEALQAYGAQFEVTFRFLERPASAWVLGDSERLMQVLTNLLSNAAKFSPVGGSVEVAVRPLGGRVRVVVADHGRGIPEHFRSRIFNRFAQADSTDTRAKGGTGLGLAISQAIVASHSGLIGFDSAEERGASFWFDLPEHRRDRLAANANAPRVLLCEDDPEIASLLRVRLECEGYAVDLAADAQSAIARVRLGGYRAMIVEMAVPGGGLELVRRLRDDPLTRALPVVVVSARAVNGLEKLEGEALGVVDFLPRPVDRQRLAAALRQAIGGRAVGQESRRARLLYVEDDADLAQVVSYLVAGFADMETATTLAEARRMLEHQPYDMVVVDVGLPDGSGLDLLDSISACRPAPKVLLFSALDHDVASLDKVAAGLVKSRTTNRQLIETIKELIGLPEHTAAGEQICAS